MSAFMPPEDAVGGLFLCIELLLLLLLQEIVDKSAPAHARDSYSFGKLIEYLSVYFEQKLDGTYSLYKFVLFHRRYQF